MPNLIVFFAILMVPAVCLLGSSIIASLLERDNLDSAPKAPLRSAKHN